jgi:hypothetical protein
MSGQAAHVGMTYRSVPHRLYVRPFKEVGLRQAAGSNEPPGQYNGWFFVTFIDPQLSETVNSEATLTALIFFACYFCIQIVFAVILVIRGPEHNKWIWPSRSKRTLHEQLSKILLAIGAVAVVALFLASGWTVILLSCLAATCSLLTAAGL